MLISREHTRAPPKPSHQACFCTPFFFADRPRSSVYRSFHCNFLRVCRQRNMYASDRLRDDSNCVFVAQLVGPSTSLSGPPLRQTTSEPLNLHFYVFATKAGKPARRRFASSNLLAEHLARFSETALLVMSSAGCFDALAVTIPVVALLQPRSCFGRGVDSSRQRNAEEQAGRQLPRGQEGGQRCWTGAHRLARVLGGVWAGDEESPTAAEHVVRN